MVYRAYRLLCLQGVGLGVWDSGLGWFRVFKVQGSGRRVLASLCQGGPCLPQPRPQPFLLCPPLKQDPKTPV